MTPRRLVLGALLAGAASLLGAAAPRPAAEPLAIIYRDMGYRGPSRTLASPSPDLAL